MRSAAVLAFTCGLLAACGGGRDGTNAPHADGTSQEAETGAAERRSAARRVRKTAEDAESGARGEGDTAAMRRDAAELQQIEQLRLTEPAEADRRYGARLARKCRSEGDPYSCEDLARYYEERGRYVEAKDAVQVATAGFQARSARGDVAASRRIDSLRSYGAALDRRSTTSHLIPQTERTPPPSSGIGMAGGELGR